MIMAHLIRKGDRSDSATRTPSSRATTVAVPTEPTRKLVKYKATPSDVAHTWIETISKEEEARKYWEKVYGWMTDYDSKGNFRPKNSIVEKLPQASFQIPKSAGHNYGWRLQTEVGKEIGDLQRRFDHQYRKQTSEPGLGYE